MNKLTIDIDFDSNRNHVKNVVTSVALEKKITLSDAIIFLLEKACKPNK